MRDARVSRNHINTEILIKYAMKYRIDSQPSTEQLATDGSDVSDVEDEFASVTVLVQDGPLAGNIEDRTPPRTAITASRPSKIYAAYIDE
jgi:hypothetical protein